MVLHSRETEDIEFWRGRLREAKARGTALDDAVNAGFDWSVIDPIHRGFLAYNGVRKSSRVLDVGCGMGRLASWFDPVGYVGLDFVPEFVEEARRRYPAYDFQIQDALKEGLPFRDNQFDVAIGVSFERVVRPNVKEEAWEAFMGELLRVAPRVIFLEFGGGDPAEIVRSAQVINRKGRTLVQTK